MDKLHIAITGRRNNGKSSLINVITGQETAIVSEIPGTTTDPVKKSYEIPGFASVVFVDTPGIDDEGELGLKRVAKTYEIIKNSDAGIIVMTDNKFGKPEMDLVRLFRKYGIPFTIVHNKSDISPLMPAVKTMLEKEYATSVIDFSAINRGLVENLIEQLKKLKDKFAATTLIGDRLHKNDIVLLVTPIDSSSPNGRLILPQVQMIRDVLDNRCVNIVMQPTEIAHFLSTTGIVPKLVITDSQSFAEVSALIPQNIPLTSFSIILARHKGNFLKYIEGTRHIAQLRNCDSILILESCSHHVSCDDIGRHKIPALLEKKTGKRFDFDFISGLDSLPREITDYALVIQCGGCMITHQQLHARLEPFIAAQIPISNYGMTIAWLQGVFDRSISVFEDK